MNRHHIVCGHNHTASLLRRKAASMLGGLAAILGTLMACTTSASAEGKIRKPADFNGDGYADLAIGAPNEGYRVGSSRFIVQVQGAGVVHVVYGSSGGLTYSRNQLLSRASEPSGSQFPAASYAQFGSSLTWGDFNKDGFDDLAIGVPGDRKYQGSVDIYFGSRSGLTARASQILTLDQMRSPTPAHSSYTAFGTALAAGDVNKDGYADLAISQYLGAAGRGAVYMVPGGVTRLNPAEAQTLYYFNLGPTSLAMGDFNGDGCFDLAMGLPYQTMSGQYYAGAVLVAYGTVYGLDSNPQIWSQDSQDIPGICEAGDQFGYSLTTADFNDDGYWDLVVGAPGENSNSGVVHVIFGQPWWGLEAWATQIWSQDNRNVFDVPEPGDRFGESVAAAVLDVDRFPDLIIGIPGEDDSRGAIQVVPIIAYSTIYQFWNQDSYQVQGGTEPGDRFGSSLVVGDFNRNGRHDVAIGVPGENSWAGAVNVLFGVGSGLSWPNNQILMQGLNGIVETEESYDGFGRL